MKCQECGKEASLPFRCPYCQDYFCPEHRLPESHKCPRMDLARAPKRMRPLVLQQRKQYEHTPAYSPKSSTKTFWFSRIELEHLALGALLVTGVGISFIVQFLSLSVLKSPEILLALLAVFTPSFLLHEIAHKLSAQHYGLWAEFRLTLFGALITLLSMVVPLFKIIAPGAVMIAGTTTRTEAGKTAAAGPLTNIVLSAICASVTAIGSSSTIELVVAFGAWINAFIALLNLIPFGMLDGRKIFQWNRMIWGLAFTAGLILTVSSYKRISTL